MSHNTKRTHLVSEHTNDLTTFHPYCSVYPVGVDLMMILIGTDHSNMIKSYQAECPSCSLPNNENDKYFCVPQNREYRFRTT